jgi:hypothetical protein
MYIYRYIVETYLRLCTWASRDRVGYSCVYASLRTVEMDVATDAKWCLVDGRWLCRDVLWIARASIRPIERDKILRVCVPCACAYVVRADHCGGLVLAHRTPQTLWTFPKES